MPLHRKHLPCDPASPHPACLQLLQGESLWGPAPLCFVFWAVRRAPPGRVWEEQANAARNVS